MSLFYFQIVSNSASVTNYIFDERKSPTICIITVVRSELTDLTDMQNTVQPDSFSTDDAIGWRCFFVECKY